MEYITVYFIIFIEICKQYFQHFYVCAHTNEMK
jgi:hypothetical protein